MSRRMLWLLCALGCASARVPSTARPPADTRASAPPELPAQAVSLVRAEAGASDWRERLPTEASRRFLVDGTRAELVSGALRTAEDGFAAPVLAALHTPQGWRFVTRHEVWEAAEFTAPARRLAWHPDARIGFGTGRIVAMHDGAATRVTLPSPVLIDAAFSDETHGVALAEPGLVYATEDGGSHWRLVPFAASPQSRSVAPADLGVTVMAEGARRWVRGERWATQLAPDGQGIGVELAAVPSLGNSVPDDVSVAIRDAHRSLDLLSARIPTRVDGSRLLIAPCGSEDSACEYDLVAEREVEGSRRPLPCAWSAGFFADAPYITCAARGEREDDNVVLYRRGDDGQWQERLRVHACGLQTPTCAASLDGSRVTCAGRCSVSSACDSSSVFCERQGSQPPQERRVGSRYRPWSLAGYDGDDMVLIDARRWLDHAETIRGRSAPTRLVQNLSESGLELLSREDSVGRDGRLRVLVHRRHPAHLWVLEGHAGQDFTERAPPPWVHTPSSRDESGFGICNNDGVTMATSPDGVPWMQESSRVAWHPLATEQAPAEVREFVAALLSTRDTLNCDATGWRYGFGRMRGYGFGPPARARHGPQGTPETRVIVPPPAPWRCTQGDGAPQPLPPVLEERSLMPFAYGATGQLAWARGRLNLTWRGSRTVVSPTDVHASYPMASPPSNSRPWALLDVSPTHARVLNWTPSPSQGATATLMELTAAGARVIARIPARPPRESDAEWPRLIAHSGDLVAALLESRETSDALNQSARVATLVTAGSSAASLDSVALSREATGAVGVYALGREVGVARLLADGTVWGGPANAPPRRLGRLNGAPRCEASAQGEFSLSTDVQLPDESGNLGPFPSQGELILGETQGVFCVRRLRAQGLIAEPDAQGLTGHMRRGDTLVPMRCAPR